MTMGLPPISANGLRGSLVEPSRAGITTRKAGASLVAVPEFIKDESRMNE
jgi:hypothetical protein